MYRPTLESILEFDNIDKNTQVLLFGVDDIPKCEGLVQMPWLDIDTWYALVDQSVWTLVRGEVSAVGSMMRGKLAFWDMYKMIGGYNSEQSNEYLALITADERYRDIHMRLNGENI